MFKKLLLPVVAVAGLSALLAGCAELAPTQMASAQTRILSKCEDLSGYQRQDCYRFEEEEANAALEGGE